MTATELRALILASGLTNSEFARRLGLAPRSMRRMLSGETPILPRTEAAICRMLGVGDEGQEAGPRDEWIVGEGPPPGRREYLIHTAAPRFIARVVAMDALTEQPEPDEEPADTMTGVTYAAGDSLICEITWIDPPPSDPTALLTLIDRAADQLDWDA